ncbi:sensor histidine kinase [Oceanobacillus luteolus]|uniref:histidine kinase n=1 Tax=Oceanobacillus luteolus TaxID=1274358 RepID=A0ABW4HMW1_9BACI
MKIYWIWLGMNFLIWPLAILYMNEPIEEMMGKLLGTALYFILLFIFPLFAKRPKALLVLLSINGILAILIFNPGNASEFNPFLLLVLTLNLAEGFFRLSLRASLIQSGIVLAGLLIALLLSGLNVITQGFVIIYILFLVTGFIYYKKTQERKDDLEVRYDVLISEYRNARRRNVTEEEMARQEERMLIAHEIHDSVGHKLTALLMQLEAYRIQVQEQDKEKVQVLKQLASESLEETRRAVKSLKASEPGGVAGILRLIRKLETESFMRFHFSVKHGAFSAPLSGEQSFVIYRSVQEALTNIMKHSDTRVAEISFEAPGGRIFRFEVSNSFTSDRKFQEGFGLKSMRERLEKHGGELEVYQTDDQFIVRGTLEIDMGDDNDSNIISGRPDDGTARFKNDD